jgi:uncharacterized protein (TIGR00645 family)
MKTKKLVENVIFNVRWVLPLFYMGLVVILFMYAFAFAREVFSSVLKVTSLSTEDLKIVVLDMVDIVMIANLVKMIITGSYHSFIAKDHGYKNENSSSGLLKIKIATSVIIVSMIHMLRSFVGNESAGAEAMHRELAYFAAFLTGSLVLGIIEYWHVKGEAIEHSIEKGEDEHHDHTH